MSVDALRAYPLLKLFDKRSLHRLAN